MKIKTINSKILQKNKEDFERFGGASMFAYMEINNETTKKSE